MSGYHVTNQYDRIRKARLLRLMAISRFGKESAEVKKMDHVIAWWQTNPEPPAKSETDAQVREQIDAAYGEVESKREAHSMIYRVLEGANISKERLTDDR